MNEDQFSALLAIIVPPIIELITKNSNVDDAKAISRFYQSKLYQELADEKSKLWHYSPMTLYTMYQDELLTGFYDYPEEAGEMSKELNFLIYCMERYRYFKGLSGADVAKNFEKYGIYEYITKYFESLHTMGDNCIVQDIDDYISSITGSSFGKV